MHNAYAGIFLPRAQHHCLADMQGSSDAVETQMRDGKFVNDWATMKLHHYKNMIKECIRELPASQARLRGGSASGSDSQQVAGSKLLSASAQLRGLAAVFQAGASCCPQSITALMLARAGNRHTQSSCRHVLPVTWSWHTTIFDASKAQPCACTHNTKRPQSSKHTALPQLAHPDVLSPHSVRLAVQREPGREQPAACKLILLVDCSHASAALAVPLVLAGSSAVVYAGAWQRRGE